jgi:hypothetical protein
VVIDATGDGDILAAAGEPFELERVHPWLWFEMSNVDGSAIPSKGLFFHTPGGGRVLVPWGGEARTARKIDATNSLEVSDALVDCREMVMAEADRLRASVPGFENATVSLMADQLGITESRRLQGEYVMTREDSMGRSTTSSLARATGRNTTVSTTSPIAACYRATWTTSSSPAAASQSITAFTTRRRDTACMATGEAAGTAAALALQSSVGVKQIDVAELQRKLRNQGAILD